MKEDDLVVKNLRLHTLRKLFNMFCIFKVEYKKDGHFPDVWQKCDGCILCDVPWRLPGEISKIQGAIDRNLCFAIWHEEIL